MRTDPSRNPGAEHRTDPQHRSGAIDIGLSSFRTTTGMTLDPDRESVVDAHILQKLRDRQRENDSTTSLGSEIVRLAGIAAALHRSMVAGVGTGIEVASASEDAADQDDRSTLSEDAA